MISHHRRPTVVSLTVGLLETGTSTATTELLWLWATRVGNEEGAVVGHEDLLDLALGGLIDVLLVPGNEGLSDTLADGIDLGRVTTTLDADADVNLLVPVGTEEEDWLPHLTWTGTWLTLPWRGGYRSRPMEEFLCPLMRGVGLGLLL